MVVKPIRAQVSGLMASFTFKGVPADRVYVLDGPLASKTPGEISLRGVPRTRKSAGPDQDRQEGDAYKVRRALAPLVTCVGVRVAASVETVRVPEATT